MSKKISRMYFDHGDYRLLDIVSEVLSSEHVAYDETSTLLRPYLHPNGVKTLVSERSHRVATAVINLISSLEKGQSKERLLALSSLHDEVLSFSGSMRYNTGRVLMQIMKTLVRFKGDELDQLKLAHDFRLAATGRPKEVLGQLRKYHLLEMPEEGNQVCFDDRVHDANTKGRKSPTHLIMDAWIKGIRGLTVVYYNYVDASVVEELLAAGKTMGISVHIGIEVTALHRNRFINFIWEPQGFSDSKEYVDFLSSPMVGMFMDRGREVSAYRQKYVFGVLERFNTKHRLKIKDDFGFEMQEIDEAEFLDFVGLGQASLVHLGSFIFQKALPLAKEKFTELNRVYKTAKEGEEKRNIEAKVQILNQLKAEDFISEYLLPGVNPDLVHYVQPAPQDPAIMRQSLVDVYDAIHAIHSVNKFTLNTVNLTQADVIELIYETEGKIDCIEFFSLRDISEERFRDGEALGELVEVLNNGDVVGLKRIVRSNISEFCLDSTVCEQESDEVAKLYEILADITTLADFYTIKRLKSYIGSGSIGHSIRSFGMGFVALDTLPVRAQREYQKRLKVGGGLCLPINLDIDEKYIYSPKKGITDFADWALAKVRSIPLIRRWGQNCTKSYDVASSSVVKGSCGNLVPLGGLKNSDNAFVLDGDKSAEKTEKSIGLRYLNSTAFNWLKVFVGLVPAFLTFSLTKDWWLLAYFGAFIWFGITCSRNIIQSVVGGGGLRRARSVSLLHWHHYINWSRVADSLLFTGFSVPLLDYLCKTLLLDQTMGVTTTTSPILLYSIMGVTNGLYISGHNLFRGLPKSAAFWNLFRSILSIPVAILFNWVVGSVLGVFEVVAVNMILQKWAAVISKLASDCVAGFIEGSADRGVNVRMRLWDYGGKIKQLMQLYAKIEILFPERTVIKMMADPEGFLVKVMDKKDSLGKALIFDSLDFMTFWCYQARASTALEHILRKMNTEERVVFFVSQLVLTQEKRVAQLLVEGYLGRDFARSLSFYLDRYKSYLQGLDAVLLRLGTTEHRSVCGNEPWNLNEKRYKRS